MKAFLIPSVFGNEPQLAALRRRVGKVLALETLELPDAHAPGRLLSDMVATGRQLAEEIQRRQPTGPIVLVGFSFGASMALELAGQLGGFGREISFLGILDGPFDPPELPAVGSGSLRFAAVRRLLKPAAVNMVEVLDPVRRLLLSTAPRATCHDERSEPMRRAMLWHLRNKALRNWVPNGCSAPGIHISTGAYGSANRERWSDLCPNLDHIEVRAVHEHLLKHHSLRVVVSLLQSSFIEHQRLSKIGAFTHCHIS